MNPRTLETVERLSRLINESTNNEATALLMELMRQAIAEDVHHIDINPADKSTWPKTKPDFTDPYRHPVQEVKYDRGCRVCGIGAGGEAMGYVCSRGDCPTRITCS